MSFSLRWASLMTSLWVHPWALECRVTSRARRCGSQDRYHSLTARRSPRPHPKTWNERVSICKVLASLSNKHIRTHSLTTSYCYFSLHLLSTYYFTTCMLDTDTHQSISHPSSFQLLHQITLFLNHHTNILESLTCTIDWYKHTLFTSPSKQPAYLSNHLSWRSSWRYVWRGRRGGCRCTVLAQLSVRPLPASSGRSAWMPQPSTAPAHTTE